MFAAYFDTETMIRTTKENDKKHEFIAYSYIIIDKYGEVRAFRDEIAEKEEDLENLPKSFLKNLLKDYKKLYSEWEKTWNRSICQTAEDEIKFKKTTNCELCNAPFNGKKDKHQ